MVHSTNIPDLAYSSEGIRGTNEKTKRVEEDKAKLSRLLTRESCERNTSAAENTTQ